MKKLSLLFMILTVTFTLQAQWVDAPINNNHIANSPGYSGEIFLSTDIENGDINSLQNNLFSQGPIFCSF